MTTKMKTEHRMGRVKRHRLLSHMREQFQRAERGGWAKAREHLLEQIASFVHIVRNTGRRRLVRFPVGWKPTIYLRWRPTRKAN